MTGRYDKINGVWYPTKKRYVKINGAWYPVKKRYDKINGVWYPSYQGYDAQATNNPLFPGGIAKDGSFSRSNIDFMYYMFKLHFEEPFTFATGSHAIDLLNVTHVVAEGSTTGEFIYFVNSGSNLSDSTLAYGTSSAMGAGTHVQTITLTAENGFTNISDLYFFLHWDYGSSGLRGYSISAPAGCIKIGEKQLNSIEII